MNSLCVYMQRDFYLSIRGRKEHSESSKFVSSWNADMLIPFRFYFPATAAALAAASSAFFFASFRS